ncbi:MAG: adenosylcobinamide-phosphate synthase CbiB [Nitrospirota bacterium]
MTEVVILTGAYILDLLIGDPHWLPHPVRFIGWGIEKMEEVLRRERRTQNTEHRLKEKLAGILLVIIIVGATYSIFYALNSLLLTSRFPFLISYLFFAILIYLTSTTLAINDLVKSGKAVIDAVNRGDKEGARRKLSMIVGRDTKELDDKGVLKAVIETLSENASDGIIAPMFYFAIGGLPLAMAYKAVNTLDSMVGYRNEKYKNFGWASARLDDVVNFIPARITGALIIIATTILSSINKLMRVLNIGSNRSTGLKCSNSLNILLRDGRKHLSPNSGIPEAAMAGALGVRLGGPSFYAGMLVEKPYIGEEKSGVKEMYSNASENAISIVKITSLFGFGLALILLYMRNIL